MNIEQIKCVIAISENKTFSEAAYSLNMTQSSLSKNIKKLELELGISLFNRTTRKVSLTPIGEEFVIYGNQILQSHKDLLHFINMYTQEKQNKLKIGSIYFGKNNRLVPLFAHFMTKNPKLELTIKDSTTTPLLQDLKKGDIDIAFVSSMYSDDTKEATFSSNIDYKSFTCFKDPYYVVVSVKHPLAKYKELSFKDLNGQSLILTSPTMDVYHSALNKAFNHYNVTIHSSICCSSVRSILQMVSQNLGIAILTKLVIEDSDDLVTIPLNGGLVRETQMLMLNKKQSIQINAFWNFIKDSFTING